MTSLQKFDGIEELKQSSLIDDNEKGSASGNNLLSKSVTMMKSISLDPHKNLPEQNALIGYCLMMVALVGMTMQHLFSKMAFFYNPKLTSYDAMFTMGLFIWPIFLVLNWYLDKPFNILKFERKQQIMLIVSVLFSILVNFCVLSGIALISITQSTLIFHLNPLFCIVLSFIILREKTDYLSILFTFGAFGGICLLTLSKNNTNNGENAHEFLGITFILLSAWLQASIMVLSRMMGISNIHFLLRSVYSSIGFLVFSLFIWLLVPYKIQFPNYTTSDLLLLFLSAMGVALRQPLISLAMMYHNSSRLAPVNYIENIFTLCADFFLFKHVFVTTEYIGMGIILVCLLVPAIIQIKKDN
ncbi:unnamed protein product [Moneuplotes crassus]|uniref:EamA domain-containing protein n=1 Tax=Euplotes crassus TaxID=5936 RepID=A0AAD2CZ68_EUPCR|nr:unnamed protein product [Moneuplotes crassus]